MVTFFLIIAVNALDIYGRFYQIYYASLMLLSGTRHTRGHTSLMGAGVVIEVRTGLVLDYHIMCNSCTTCTKMANKRSMHPKLFSHFLVYTLMILKKL